MRTRMNAIITLKSDLCVGSGFSYAGTVDSDICFTDGGLPYIPARRIKGCLKECAEMISSEHIEQIFGTRGNDSSGSLRLSDAYLKDNQEYLAQLRQLRNSEYRDIFSTQAVLNQLTYVKAQTAINKESGKAEDNSLRFMRVVNHYAKENVENVFILEFEIDKIYKEEISRIFKALRNIGMNRNRGLGAVSCRVKEIESVAVREEKKEYDSNKKYIINYSIKNVQPLMMSNENDEKSETYISGQSVLGFFASGYDGNQSSFDDLFLKGNTIFSNLYLEEDGIRFIPVPMYINKLKKTKVLVNSLLENNSDNPLYSTGNGNLPKQINSEYISLKDNKAKLKTPLLDVVYHHSKRSEDNPDGVLYYFTEMNKNQTFRGYIITSGDNVNFTLNTLENHSMYFGKSKSAQYGKCLCLPESICVNEYTERIIHLEKGSRFMVNLASDGIFIKESEENAYYTVLAEDIKKIIAEELGFTYEEDEAYRNYVKTKLITGYNTKWNLKRPSVLSVAAGSCFEYVLNEDADINISPIGERNHEGFGEFTISTFDDMNYVLSEDSEENNKEAVLPKNANELINRIIIDSLYTKLFDESLKEKRSFQLNN